MRTKVSIIILTVSFLSACVFNTDTEKLPVTTSQDSVVTRVIDSSYFRLKPKIDSFFIQKAKTKRFSGTYLFAKDGVVFAEGAIGYRDFKTKDTLQLNDVFQLASVSKPITAVGVLKLIEEGKLHLDDDIRDFFPDFPYDGITVQLLLSHRHGLPNYMYFSDKYWKDKHQPICNDSVIALFEKHEPARYYMPNRRYNYSNSGYALLASIIENVSGKSYEAFMKEKVFTATGMKTAEVFDLCKDTTVFEKNVKGHIRRKRKAGYMYLDGVVGDKGIYASIYDLLSLDSALHHGFLSDSILNLAYSPQHKDLRDWDNYGLGWRLNLKNESKRLIWHSGWWKGFKNYYLRLEDQDIVVVVLTNRLYKFLNKKDLVQLVDPEYENR